MMLADGISGNGRKHLTRIRRLNIAIKLDRPLFYGTRKNKLVVFNPGIRV
jgi:hypothetical protein